MNLSVISKNSAETQKIGKLLVDDLNGGEVFGLTGNLGSGKTTFIQGVALSLRIREKIKSPSFVILKRYKILKHKTIKYLYHIDLYRLSNFLAVEKNLDSLGFDLNEIAQKNSIVFIEWPEKIAPILPRGWIKIKFEYINKEIRKITIG